MKINEEETKQINIRLTDAEIAAVRNITKVDAVAPAVVSIVRQRIENEKIASGDARESPLTKTDR